MNCDIFFGCYLCFLVNPVMLFVRLFHVSVINYGFLTDILLFFTLLFAFVE
jgi:hypothetical protein